MKTTNVPSPCILICVIEPQSGHCYGCGRTGDEIAGWMNMNDDQQLSLIGKLPDRLKKLPVRKKRVTKRRRMAASLETNEKSA